MGVFKIVIAITAHKNPVAVSVYIKENFKVSPMEKISSVSDNGFQQLWLKVQKSLLKVIPYLYSLSSAEHTI